MRRETSDVLKGGSTDERNPLSYPSEIPSFYHVNQ